MTKEGYIPKVEAQPSVFDLFLILNASKEECKRRAQNRKIDPASGTVYHMDDNPPPEDPKLREKLTDYFGNYPSVEEMLQKIDSNHIIDSENSESLLKFVSIFGHYDHDTDRGL